MEQSSSPRSDLFRALSLAARVLVIALIGVLAIESGVLWPPVAIAQNSSAIRGMVTVPTGEPLPGVTVTIFGDRNYGDPPIETLVAVSNEQGRYAFPSVPAGHYIIQFALEGFQKRGLQVFVAGGATAEVDTKLSYEEPVP